MSDGTQYRLLTQRRFLPFFGAQALGAFNDNVYKNVLVILAAYQTASYTQIDPRLLTNLAGGLFILPYILFSGIAGQFADRFDKALMLKLVKAVELPIMALAGVGFALHDLALLLAALFLMGVHSTFFAPAKYGLLPEVLHDTELIGGNALLEMGTFLAILFGTLGAGVLAARGDFGLIVFVIVAVSASGFLISLAIPRLRPAAPDLRINWRLWSSTWDNVRVARASRVVFLSILGISWFWFYGALVLAQLPAYAKSVLGGNEQVITALLVIFSLGIGFGALLCERLSGHKVEIGLVPFGSIGLTVFAIDFYRASPAAPAPAGFTAFQVIAQLGWWRPLVDLGLIGVFGGFFIVPLYALVQQRAPRDAKSRVIAANNILNAVFIVVAAFFGAIATEWGLSIPQLLFVTGLMNAVVAAYIYGLVPEFLLRFLCWLLIHFAYRLDKRGLERIPEEGPALLICNHVGYVDALVISAACRRPIRFIMESGIFKNPLLGGIFRGMKAIPVAPAKQDRETYERAFAIVASELRDGNLVCIFPEGRLTADGEVGEFHLGMMRILRETPVPVVPLALSGLWHSMFSRKEKSLWRRWPRGIWPKIALHAGEPVEPSQATLQDLRERVVALRGAWQ